MPMTSQVLINDVTLRDGEQTANVAFSLSEKCAIAQMLDDIGVAQIEAGIPAMGGEEKEAVAAIAAAGHSAMVAAWSRADTGDIQQCLECDVDAIGISLPVSDGFIKGKLSKDRRWVLERLRHCVAMAATAEVQVCVGAEDASRADLGFLAEYAEAARVEGASRLRYCDTLGILDPFSAYDAITQLRGLTGLEIEIHCHNDFGLATANSLAAIRAGASWASTTLGGLGERAGNAALEELGMALEQLSGIDTGLNSLRYKAAVAYVMSAAQRSISPGKPVVGTAIFDHESGIHVAGMLKDSRYYEPFPPETVGGKRHYVIGKHSGSHALAAALDKLGIPVDATSARQLLHLVRKLAIVKKRALTNNELLSLVSCLT